MENFNTILEGTKTYRNHDDNYDWKVLENNGLAMLVRNQGQHDRRFSIIVAILPTDKAIQKAKKIFMSVK